MARAPKAKRTIQTATHSNILKEILENEAEDGPMFSFDSFIGDVILMRPIVTKNTPAPAVFSPRVMDDVDGTQFMIWLEDRNFTKVGPEKTERAVKLAAKKRTFSSAQQWLLGLPQWDGVERLESLWETYLRVDVACEGMGEERILQYGRYLRETGKCFMLSIVARIMVPGIKADCMPVIEGKQGIGKSTFLRILCPNDDWFSDSMVADLKNKDARSHLAGKLLIEMAELSSLKGTKLEPFKAFLSAQDDKYRPSYGRGDIIQKRTCIFVGTTNSDDYLSDATGNRRFWPIRSGGLERDKLIKDRDQLYAEALHLWNEGERHYLSQEVEIFAALEQGERVDDEHPWDGAIWSKICEEAKISHGTGQDSFFVTPATALKAITMPPGGFRDGDSQKAAKILRKYQGVKQRQQRINGLLSRPYLFKIIPEML